MRTRSATFGMLRSNAARPGSPGLFWADCRVVLFFGQARHAVSQSSLYFWTVELPYAVSHPLLLVLRKP